MSFFFLCLALLSFTITASGQTAERTATGRFAAVSTASASPDLEALPDAPQPVGSGASAAAQENAPPPAKAGNQAPPAPPQQPKRILGIMPNYRAVSAGAVRTPPTAKGSFKIATDNSFDYSAFVFTALTSLIAEGQDSHPQLGKGVPGFWAYSWRGYVDKTDGNYLVLFALPTIFHQDERYYTLGKGSIFKRAVYSLSTVFITPNYSGNKSFNISELLGRGMAEAISTTYYPAQDRTFGDVASKYGYAVMRDGLTNTFREFWPDIAVHVLRRHP